MRHSSLCLGSLLLLLAIVPMSACDSASDATTGGGTSSVEPDAGESEVVSKCPAPIGPGTKHSADISSDETWTADQSPHLVDYALTIDAGRTLTLEPCTVVRFTPDAGLLVKGTLVAEGAADRRIRLERADADEPWHDIEVRQGASARLSYVTIDGGGEPDNGAPSAIGMLDIRGDQEAATQPVLFANHLEVSNSSSLGILVREGGGFTPGSDGLKITGGASYPISIWGRAAGTLPKGSYTGNADDEIFVPAGGGRDDVLEDATFASLGVPYRIGGALVVGAGTEGARRTTLTIEPGVTMRFEKLARLVVNAKTTTDAASGVLRAEGTAAAPIVLTSAESLPAAGDWVGVMFRGTPDAESKMTHTEVRYAGADSQASSFGCPSPANDTFSNEAAVLVLGNSPSTQFLTESIIADSAGDGVVRGWTGAEIDFLATNSFLGIARCNQTYPKPESGVCSENLPCPK